MNIYYTKHIKHYTKHIKKTVLVLALGSFCCMVANQFVVKKQEKPKELSRSKVQEACCCDIADMLHELPLLLKQVATMQELGMKHLCGFFQGDKAAFIESADKEKLLKMHKQVTEMCAYLKEINSKLAEQTKNVQAL
ncbi:MAG: hypothetical protein NT124_00060 [Candidatus Dependentiae bacterium]|nr:hypothetical protein [Candidatus Dependentiae bacterium]